MNLQGKVAIVTGGSRGLGKAFADMMVKAVSLLATQDSKGITGTIATDRELCTWHGLL